MLTLHDSPRSLNCYKVRLLLALLGVAHRRVFVDLRKGDHRTPAFLALNPFGQVPVLVADGLVLRDSQAMLVWLARTHGAAAASAGGEDRWMPRAPDDEAVVNAWLAAAAFELRLGPYDARLKKIAPALCVNAAAVVENSARALALYEGRLRDHEWVALAHPTVADVAAFPALAHAGEGDIDLAPYPAVLAWLDRMRRLPGWVALDA
jgi:glutathione S-transferase